MNLLVPIGAAFAYAFVLLLVRRLLVDKIQAGKISLRTAALVSAVAFSFAPFLTLIWWPDAFDTAVLASFLILVGGVLGVFIWLAVLTLRGRGR